VLMLMKQVKYVLSIYGVRTALVFVTLKTVYYHLACMLILKYIICFSFPHAAGRGYRFLQNSMYSGICTIKLTKTVLMKNSSA